MKNKVIEVSFEHKEELCKIYQEFVTETHSSQPEDIKLNFDSFFMIGSNHLALVLQDDKVAGFVEYRYVAKKLRDKNQKVEITSLFVREAYRKMGLGKDLIEFVREFALKTGKDRLVLYSGLELKEAHKFYTKIGFIKDAYFFVLKV